MRERMRRITIGVRIEETLTEAIIDTGAPYVVCSPCIARQVNLDTASALFAEKLLIRGVWVKGGIHRINISFLADQGESLLIEAPAFIPDPEQEFTQGFLPRSFLGMLGCFEIVR